MKNSAIRRVFGMALIIIAAAGLLLSVVGVISIWRMRQPLTDSAMADVRMLAGTLDTTNQALLVVSTTLQTADQALDTVDRATLQSARALSDTQTTLSSFASLLGTDLPASINAAGTALRSAQTSARVIDDALGALSRVPLIGLRYTPDAPLSATLGDVAGSLDNMPGALSSLGRDLITAASSVGDVAANLGEVPPATAQVRRNLSDAQAVLTRYRNEVVALQKLTTSIQASLASTITIIAIASTFVVFWLVLAQVMILLKGLEWMRGVRG